MDSSPSFLAAATVFSHCASPWAPASLRNTSPNTSAANVVVMFFNPFIPTISFAVGNGSLVSLTDFVQASGIIAKDALLRLIGQVAPLLKTPHALGDMVGAREVGKVGREHEHFVAEQLHGEGQQ